MNRTASRLAVRTLAWAAVPVLFAAGCSSSDSGSDEKTSDEAPRSVAPTPEPVRFAALPEACSVLGEDVVADVVPEADPKEGETLTSTDTATSGACLWSGLDEYQFRSLTVALRRFESDVALGSGDERAGEYLQQMVEEVTGDEANTGVESAELGETGDAATSIAYTVVKETEEEGEQEFRQQRIVARTGNVVITLDYSGVGFEGDDMPSADSIREAAETAAREVVATLDASAEEAPAEGQEEQPETDEDKPEGEQQDS
ncbi:hypothetical protein [Streptomyces specialis]|uniref:hypothetical protein n=1 Tax=Streptomyces specialis TaxID=498367 RepID=UPI00073F8B45|nr:hypothetical protein [Streptomyces specialis]